MDDEQQSLPCNCGNQVVQNAIDELLKQTRAIERGVSVLELKSIDFEGSDSLDASDKVKG